VSEACERNKGPILAVLREELAASRRVLEVGSGTGQHAVYFAAGLTQLLWQPSELAENLAPLAERVRLEGGANVRAPLALDVRARPWPAEPVDALFSANTLHIMAWSSVREFFRGAAAVLLRPAVLCVYGPFRFEGRHTSDSNAAFDHYLRQRDPTAACAISKRSIGSRRSTDCSSARTTRCRPTIVRWCGAPAQLRVHPWTPTRCAKSARRFAPSPIIRSRG
jgi:hypothetical protein